MLFLSISGFIVFYSLHYASMNPEFIFCEHLNYNADSKIIFFKDTVGIQFYQQNQENYSKDLLNSLFEYMKTHGRAVTAVCSLKLSVLNTMCTSYGDNENVFFFFCFALCRIYTTSICQMTLLRSVLSTTAMVR